MLIKEIPVEKVLDYHLGDIVYIGSDSYEISNIGVMNVQLYDLKFPLLGREMSIEEFEKIIKENPSNSHLYKTREKAEEYSLQHEGLYWVYEMSKEW